MSSGSSEHLVLTARSEAAWIPGAWALACPLVGKARVGVPGERSLEGSVVGFPPRTKHQRVFPAALSRERRPVTAAHLLPSRRLSSQGGGRPAQLGGPSRP